MIESRRYVRYRQDVHEVPPESRLLNNFLWSDNEVMTISSRVAVVEDHVLVREGIERILNDSDELDVVWSGDDPVKLLHDWPAIDVILLDLELNGEVISLEVVNTFLERGARVLVVSAHNRPALIRDLVFTGVHAVVSKTESSQTMLDATLKIAHGEFWTTRELAGALVNAPPDDMAGLSAQEIRVLRLYASGLKINAVASRMEVSPHTVKGYLKRIRRKLAESGRPATTQRDLYAEARRRGILGD